MRPPAPALLSRRVYPFFGQFVWRVPLLLVFAAIWSAGISAQTTQRRPLITQPVEESKRTILRGNTYPLARPQFDRGAAPASLPMNRMLLVLRRPPELETALDALLDQQQDKSSPNYHAWLTPEQFGQQFGPADADIQAISSWLQLQGFQIAKVSNGRTVIEFSGTAVQVQSAFHTEIHKYTVDGADHWANATDPQIPTALVPAVAGVLTLHNFPRHPMHRVTGVLSKSKSTGQSRPVSPLFTFSGQCTQSGNCFGLGPYDFATIYNVLPLWTATPAIDGTGQSIAIVGETTIDLQDIRAFRNLFGLPPNDPQIIFDGPPPNTLEDEEVESDLDVQWSGAVARGATIQFVTAASTNTTAGVDLSAEHIVDNNLAPILSESYGECEPGLGTSGNLFFSQLWQQAAAQGITVFISTGDSASAGCDRFRGIAPQAAQFGLQVSGFASTPYNVAVGGTDFNDIANPTAYWNVTNTTSTQASAKGYIPETTWNDSCTSGALTNFGYNGTPETNCNNSALSFIVWTNGGSGGKSGCTSGDGMDVTSCSGGYAKPSWQTGVGVPNDGKRDIPDVSLFASAGFYTGSFYVVCDAHQTNASYCDQNPSALDFLGVGGTSASTPSFAGIMALIDQKTQSRQGNANYVFYKLAAQQPASGCNSSTGPMNTCVFNDVTSGTIAVPCDAGTLNCNTQNPAHLFGVLSGYGTSSGYDLATGLGSVNATNLVNAWATSTAGLKASATALSITPSPLNITHGATANLNISVTPGPGATGTPTGEVSLLASTGLGVASFLLTNGTVSGTTGDLPGGNYIVTAHYPGDATFSASDSPGISVRVSPEPSATTIEALTADANNNPIPFTSGPYGGFVYLRADVNGQSGNGTPTGHVTIKDNGTAIAGNPYTLNSEGNTATPNGLFNLAVGQHSLTAAYTGDMSFSASSSSAAGFSITQQTTRSAFLDNQSGTITAGTTVTINATVLANGAGMPPGGTMTFMNGGVPIGAPVAVSVYPFAKPDGTVQSLGTITTQLPVGLNVITAKYNGDANYTASTTVGNVSLDEVIPVNVTVTSSNPSIQQGQSVTFTAQLTPTQNGPPLTGTIQFSANSSPFGSPVQVLNGQAQITTSKLVPGGLSIDAIYSGDTNYRGAGGTVFETVTVGPDFSIAANPTLITIARPGQSGSTSLMLTVMNGLSGTFTLAPQCTGLPSQSSCSVSPTSVTFNSTMTTANVMLTVSTTAQSSAAPKLHVFPTNKQPDLLIAFSLLALFAILAALRNRKSIEFALGLATFATLLTFAACGGGGGGGGAGGGGGGNPGTPVGLDPNAVVTFTLGTATHSVSLSVNVQ